MTDLTSAGALSKSWKLHLFGSFCLTDPEGENIRVADRKVQGLLAVLALHRDHGIERRVVADILWPSKSPENLANLRQALALLRRLLGETAIEASRQHCRLNTGFPISCDFEDPAWRTGVFMPGQEGEWFEGIRLESQVSDSSSFGAPESVVSSFYNTLEWFAVHDRQGMHALMSTRRSLTRGFAYSDLLRLLRAAPDNPSHIGWTAYWQGTAEDDLQKCAELLRVALREARASRDLSLASEVCLELGKVYSRTGQIRRAIRICDIADGVADTLKTRSARSNALRLRGSVWTNWEDQAVGLALLRKAEADIEDPVERAMSICSRAFSEASARSFDTASQTIEGSVALSKQLGHHRIGAVSALTKVLLQLTDGHTETCISALVELVAFYRQNGFTQFAVYAEEILAKLHLQLGEKPAARARLLSAQKARASSQMVVTKLEAQRVAQLV